MEFDWDGANVTHIGSHGITPAEVEQAYRNEPLVIERQDRNEIRQLCLGETDDGRLLAFVFTERGDKLRIVTAYPMHKKQREFYLAENK